MKRPGALHTPYADVAATPTDWSATEPWVRFGVRAIAALCAGTLFGVLIVSRPAAVVRTGIIVAESEALAVPSTFAGVVMKLLVSDGDFVQTGQPLMVLDDTNARTGLVTATSRLEAYAIQEARLTAEQLGENTFEPPASIDVANVETAKIVAAERALFDGRRAARADRQKALSRRLPQIDRDIAEAAARLVKLQKDRDQNEREMSVLGTSNGGAVANPQRVGNLQRESVRIGSDIGGLKTEIAKLKGARAEVESLLSQSGKQYAQLAAEELQSLQPLIAEATEAKAALDKRIAAAGVVASPVTGTVQGFVAPPVGASVQQGDVLAHIQPGDGGLLVSVRIARETTSDITEGAPATVRLPSSFASAAPWLAGRVRSVSSETGGVENAVGEVIALIAVPRDEAQRGARGASAAPGAPVEVAFATPETAPPSVAMTPVSDAQARASR
ncbi:MAG: HlyD family efflux transporter periplasmic adaptor subunit [Hyphomicrobium sp.]